MIVSQRINARKIVLAYLYRVYFLDAYQGTQEQSVSLFSVATMTEEEAFFVQGLGMEQEEESLEPVFEPSLGVIEDDTAFICNALGIKAQDVDWEYVFQIIIDIPGYKQDMSQLIDTYTSEFRYEEMELLKKAIFTLGYVEHKTLGTDNKVIINEMIELAKRFGNVDTFKLINSIFHGLLMQ